MTAVAAYAHVLKRLPAQQRSTIRVERLVDAAASLLADREPEEVTVRDLAARARVPTGTLYQFFEDRDAVLQALAARYVAALAPVLDRLLADPGPSWERTIDRIVDGYADMVREHPSMRRLWLAGTLDTATRRLEREADATLASRIGAVLQRQAGTRRGNAEQWRVLVALIGALLTHAFAVEPAGDEAALREARRAARAYAGAVLGAG